MVKKRHDKTQHYFIHKTAGPVQVLMEYSVHPVPTGNPWQKATRNAGTWYKYQTQDEFKEYGMCQDSDLSERIPMEDSWKPEWMRSKK